MEFFLPIAEVKINILMVLVASFFVGFLSGLFGIGGGFLMTPLLIFFGIPPVYAVANEANNILGSSISGSLTHWFRKTLDYKIGLFIVLGGFLGIVIGILIFEQLSQLGKINTVISLLYVYLLLIIGSAMFTQGATEINNSKRQVMIKRKLHLHFWIHGLPFRTRFHKSQLYASALSPIILGIFTGVISAIMGVGGAFIMVPVMIYILGMPTKLVPGTSLFVTVFITAAVVIAHAVKFQSIDITLVLILITGSIFGIHLGHKASTKLNTSEYKTLLAILLLTVGILMGVQTFVMDFTSIESILDNEVQINKLGEIVLSLFNKSNFLYICGSILSVIIIGILFAALREYVHNLRAGKTKN